MFIFFSYQNIFKKTRKESRGREEQKEKSKVGQKSKMKHYLNEPALNKLLIGRKKAVIDLREDHLSRCARSEMREDGEDITVV